MENPLERIRKEYGLTREEMAAVLRISTVSYNSYARGTAFLGKTKIELLAQFFSLNLEELLKEFTEWKNCITQKRREEALKKVKLKRRSQCG